MLYFILSTFSPIWKVAMTLHLLWEYTGTFKAATRTAVRAYLAILGLGLVSVAGAGLRHEAAAGASLPARTIVFWLVWYVMVLAGCVEDRRRYNCDWVLAAATVGLAWALAQPDVLRMLDFGLADLGATAVVYGGDSPEWLMLWRSFAYMGEVYRKVSGQW